MIFVNSALVSGRDIADEMSNENVWNLEKLRTYFDFCKRIEPEMGDDARTILSKYYVYQRNVEAADKSRTTVRLLQSAIRLSQGHARLMQHHTVEIMDAVFAVLLLELTTTISDETFTGSSLIHELNENLLHNSFPDDPTQNYLAFCEKILLGLSLNEIWEQELKSVSKAM